MKLVILMKSVRKTKAERKVKKVMHEWKAGKLHSGSKKGPVVEDHKQAVAIALHESNQAKKGRAASRKKDEFYD